MKIVINKCFGGFSLSDIAMERIKNFMAIEDEVDYRFGECSRTSKVLIETIETLGEKANGSYANLYIVEIPDDATDFEIMEYDGSEYVIYVQNGKIKKVF